MNTALAEAYGPVVLKPSGRTWRSERATGGGCLYDYAAHPLNLLTWYLGEPESVSGCQLTSIFSAQIDDAVSATLHYAGGTAQLISQLVRRVAAQDDHEDHAVGTSRSDLRRPPGDPGLPAGHRARTTDGYRAGWNVKYTTDLTENVWFYLRGEEYSAQLDAFVHRVEALGEPHGENDFGSAAVTDRVIAMIADSRRPATDVAGAERRAAEAARSVGRTTQSRAARRARCGGAHPLVASPCVRGSAK